MKNAISAIRAVRRFSFAVEMAITGAPIATARA